MSVVSEPVVVPPVMDERFRVEMTVACKDCDGIPKVHEAGKIFVQDGQSIQIMHNGLAVIEGGYHGDWMAEVIARLGGHHEPQEELVFHEILKRVSPRARMIELGCFWAYYSLWFLKDHPERVALGIEPDANNLKIGQANALMNELRPDFLQGAVGQHDLNSIDFLSETCGLVHVPMFRASTLCRDWGKGKVDILHCDAQGAEVNVLQDCEELLRAGAIRFLVLSTHAEAISGDALTHQRCLNLIQRFGGQVLAEHDVHESFSGDGLIAAHFGPQMLDWPDLQLSRNRYSTSLFRNPLYDVVELRRHFAELANQTTDS